MESINSKINFYLPKRLTNNLDFIETIKKIIINSKFNDNEIKRHDYITQSILEIIKIYDFNNNITWIKYETFKKEQIKLMKNEEIIQEEQNLEKLYNEINDLNNENINNSFDSSNINNLTNDEKKIKII